MTISVRRREFIAGLGGAALAWPHFVHAQQPAMPVVGFLTSLGRDDRPNLAEAARRGLSEAGFVDGRNVTIEYRFAENQIDRLPALAADLVDRKAAVILAAGGGNSVLAAKASSTTIPIVFLTGGDPVRQGFVGSLNRPGGNVTGVNWFGSQARAARGWGCCTSSFPVLRSSPCWQTRTFRNPRACKATHRRRRARSAGNCLFSMPATPSEIDAAFATLRQRRVGALLVSSDPFFTSRRQQIVALAARDAIPAMYFNREFVADGGLMSYGNDIADAYRRAGVYVGRILNGAKPADLPVDQATKFEFVINLKTAKALGIEVPPGLSARADEVIE